MVEGDKATLAEASTSEQVDVKWGRVLICGGTDWPNLGRKQKGGAVNEKSTGPDLLEPHILRSLSNIKVVSIHASCSGCHFIAIDTDGDAWMFGRNAPSALGVPKKEIPETNPRHLQASELGAPKGTKFVHAAVGRGHSLLVGSNGDVWSAGVNSHGQCGQPVCAEVSRFTIVKGPKEKIVKAAVGITFSILLTEGGKLLAFGSGEHGQLGNGRTGEHIATGNKSMYDVHSEPTLVKGLEDKVITQVACGTQHSIALDSSGFVYVWGYNGYCRLGLGNQQDTLVPKVVPNFAGPSELTRGRQVAAGPTNSVVIDGQRMYWMAGKWKNSGDGSSGSPYSSFRYMQDIMGCKMFHIASGGVTHFALAPDDDGSVMTIAWGQNASNGELGLGINEPKSATKPTRHQPLIGVEVFDVAASQNTTFFLAKPSARLSELPRHPAEVNPPELCIVCNDDKGADDDPLECDKCDTPYHIGCLNPPLDAVPEGEWFCPVCLGSAVPSASTATKKAKAIVKGGKAKVEDDKKPKGATGRKVSLTVSVSTSSKGGRGGKRKGSPETRTSVSKRRK